MRLLALLAALAGLAAAGAGGPSFAGRPGARGGRGGLLAVAGGAAELRCAVRHLGDRVVSWVRSRDLQILTTAGLVFTGDARVSAPDSGARASGESAESDVSGESDVSAESGESDVSVHTLRIAPLRASDAGRYECQVNTEPKMSLMVDLEVVDEEVPHIEVSVGGRIEDGSEDGGEGPARAVLAGVVGAPARLWCAARWVPPPRRPAPPLHLRWTKDGRELVGAGARLQLAPLQRRHAGRYACHAAPPARAGTSAALQLLVHAAGAGAGMQRDEAARAAIASDAARSPAGRAAPLLAAVLAALLALAAAPSCGCSC